MLTFIENYTFHEYRKSWSLLKQSSTHIQNEANTNMYSEDNLLLYPRE